MAWCDQTIYNHGIIGYKSRISGTPMCMFASGSEITSIDCLYSADEASPVGRWVFCACIEQKETLCSSVTWRDSQHTTSVCTACMQTIRRRSYITWDDTGLRDYSASGMRHHDTTTSPSLNPQHCLRYR